MRRTQVDERAGQPGSFRPSPRRCARRGISAHQAGSGKSPSLLPRP